jgi:ELWxxDGT repeat protein
MLLAEPLEPRVLLSVTPVADLNPTPATSNPIGLVDVGGVLYFSADDGVSGRKIWKSNGTSAGTVNALPGLTAEVDTLTPALTPLATGGTKLFFRAATPAAGSELWTSNGTDAGTSQVKDIRPGPAGSDVRPLAPGVKTLTPIGNTVFFAADDGVKGPELWKSDGTAAGTQIVKDVTPGANGTDFDSPVVLNGILYFTAAAQNSLERELWRSDGTDQGTFIVKDISSGALGGSPLFLTASGGALYFSAQDDTGFRKLWRSDGTANGTQPIKDVVPLHLADLNGTLYFGTVVINPVNPVQRTATLWKSNGTTAGTVAVKEIGTGSGANLYGLTAVADQLFFAANDGLTGHELWVSNGTTAGTRTVGQIVAGSAGSDPRDFTANGDLLYFTAAESSNTTRPRQVWVSDGSTDGTYRPRVVAANGAESSPRELTVSTGGDVFFTADGGNSGRELWSTDGTETGTSRVRDIRPGTQDSSPTHITTFNGALYFRADATPFTGGSPGEYLWKSDGTATGTVRIESDDLFSGPPVQPEGLTVSGGKLFFVASSASGAFGLWVTTGIPGPPDENGEPGFVSAELLRSFEVADGDVPELADVNGVLYFAARTESGGRELWKSNGTAEGTVLVKDIRTGAASSDPRWLTALGSQLLFAADDGTGTNDVELWVSDGTAAGTQRLAQVVPGPVGSHPSELTRLGPVVFFTVLTAAGRNELWRTNGTAAGTSRVKAFDSGANGEDWDLTAVGPSLLFRASDAAGGLELWRSNGTEAGTVRVKDINPGAGPSSPRHLVVNGTTAYFAADGAAGAELWKSDGTEGGTVQVDDLRPGPAGSDPRDLAVAGGLVYFSADEGTGGQEPWQSDGTAAGTRRVSDLYAGPVGSSPSGFTQLGNDVYFAAGHPFFGRELWRLTADDTTAPALVAAPTFDPSSSAPRLRFQFTEDVSGNLAADALTVRRLDPVTGAPTGAAIVPTGLSYDDPNDIATFTFASGAFPDGNYRATLSAARVTDAAGNPLSGDVTFAFFTLAGDINRDRAVNGTDFAILAGSFGKTAQSYSTGDLNGDGAVNGSDFALLAGNFGRTLPAPPAAVVAAAPAAAVAVSTGRKPVGRHKKVAARATGAERTPVRRITRVTPRRA